jgi:hypothetical protein
VNENEAGLEVLNCTNVVEIKILESTLLNFDASEKGPKIHFS